MLPDEKSRPAGNRAATSIVDGDAGTILAERSDSPTVGALRRTLVDAAERDGLGLSDLTVLAAQNDPFRVDTPARHRDGSWLAVTLDRLGLDDREIHIRGLHYALIGQVKPDGSTYTNDADRDWLWLGSNAVKAARYLGYIDFDRIIDQRNDAPAVVEFSRPDPFSYVGVGAQAYIPRADELMPRVGVDEFDGVQPYRLVLVGEKSSLKPVLSPVAKRYRADLYLPTGEISDTLAYKMARHASEDERPLVVFYFADSDPSGWQMPISLARKLQAFRALHFPSLEFEIHRVGLTPDQVREYGLPSTPLKESEKRGDRWRQATGTAQTEVDALASLRPELLTELAREAIAPYFDHTLDHRVMDARRQWLDVAQAELDSQLDGDRLDTLRQAAESQLGQMREQIDMLNDALRLDVTEYDLPPIDVPTAHVDGSYGTPLLDSRWSFTDQTRRLRADRRYESGGGSDE